MEAKAGLRIAYSNQKGQFDAKSNHFNKNLTIFYRGVMAQMARQVTQDCKVLGSLPVEARKFFLFSVGCFGAYEICL